MTPLQQYRFARQHGWLMGSTLLATPFRETRTMPRIIIRHPRTGHEVGIESGDFKRRKLATGKDGKPTTYEDAGYRIVSQMDGQPYQQPAAPKTEG